MKLKKVSKESMDEITKAFSEYQYEDTEKGLYYLCKGKKGIENYMKGFALAGIKVVGYIQQVRMRKVI